MPILAGTLVEAAFPVFPCPMMCRAQRTKLLYAHLLDYATKNIKHSHLRGYCVVCPAGILSLHHQRTHRGHTMSKAQKIANALNSQPSSDPRLAAERLAESLGVTLYWLGTASGSDRRLPAAQVLMANGRVIGEICLCHDGKWNA